MTVQAEVEERDEGTQARREEECAQGPCDRRPLTGHRLCGLCLDARQRGYVVVWWGGLYRQRALADQRTAPPLTPEEDGRRHGPARLPDAARPSAWDRLFQ